MNKEILQNLSEDQWKEITELLREEIGEGKKPSNFRTEGKSNEQIAREVSAREMAAKIVLKIIKKIEGARFMSSTKEESYK